MDQKPLGYIERESGVIHPDGIHFHIASDFAKEHLYWIHFAGQSIACSPYKVDRGSFDFFILFFIQEGRLHFTYNGHSFTASAGTAVILDCKKPQLYWAEDKVRFKWIHFAGNSSQAYYDFLYQTNKCVFPGVSGTVRHLFTSILDTLQKEKASDHRLSAFLHSILSELCIYTESGKVHSSSVRQAKSVMDNNYMEELTVSYIAAQAAMSQYHLSRLFKKETGYSIHEYLLNLRLNHAKEKLSETDASVGKIAEECGFSSTSHFIRAFKKSAGLTPLKFRTLF